MKKFRLEVGEDVMDLLYKMGDVHTKSFGLKSVPDMMFFIENVINAAEEIKEIPKATNKKGDK